MFPLLLSLLASPAHATDWSDFADAFPKLPCADGWVACVVGDRPISPEPLKDQAGVPTPSDLRVSWFALDAQPAFDPFPGLSRYSGPLTTERVASTAEPPDTQPPELSIETPRDVEEPSEPRQVEPRGESKPPPNSAASGVSGPPAAGQACDPQEFRAIAANNSQALEGWVCTCEQLPGNGTTCSVATVESPAEQGIADAPIAPSANPTRLEDCGPRDVIEGKAMLGRLDDAQRACLENVAGSGTSRTTVRSKASRPLLFDSWYSGDKARWEQLVVRHLDEIERSDPAIAMNYASHLARQGRSPAAVIRWSDVALENRHVWTGPSYQRNTLKLRGLKARAAARQWQALEMKKAEGEAVDGGALQRWRTDTVTFAREWREYSVAVGKPSDKALALCISAAGTEDACR